MQGFKQWFQRFMTGRYGIDVLGRDMMWLSIILLIIGMFVPNLALKNGLRIAGLLVMALLYFRLFSKNYSKRYNENRRYTNRRGKITDWFGSLSKRIKDFPKYKRFKCPNCQQTLRVPRGKKKIVVTCPKCQHKFDART